MQGNLWLRLLSICLCVTTASLSTAQTTAPLPLSSSPGVVAPPLRILILEGEGALNNIRERTAREPIVQVTDKNDKPVAGATVLFLLPGSGPGGAFANGAQSLTVVTDQSGRARASGFRPNEETGAFAIRVTATFAELKAETVIRQGNYDGAEEGTAKAKPSHGLGLKWVLIGVAIAGAAGIAAAAKGGGGGKALTITPGAGTVGPPK